MPVLAKLTTTPNIRHNIHTAQVVHENEVVHAECGDLRISKSTVAIKNSWNWLLWLLFEIWEDAFLSDEEHRHLSSILALIPGLIGREIG